MKNIALSWVFCLTIPPKWGILISHNPFVMFWEDGLSLFPPPPPPHNSNSKSLLSLSCSKLSLFANMYPMNILRNIAFQPLHSTLFILTAGLQAFSTSALLWRTANVHLNNVSNFWLLIFLKFSPPMNFTSILILLSIPMVKNWTFPIPRIVIIFKAFYGSIIHIQKCIYHTCIVWVFWARQAVSTVWD